MKHLEIWFLVFVFVCMSISIAWGGDILDVKLESPSIAKNKVGISSTRLINVYIPTGYENGNLRYPTIYWIGGYTDNNLYNYSKMLDDAIQNGKIAPVIVVFINTPEGTWFVNSDITGYWEDFLVKEIVPYIDSNYRTIPDMKKRGIGGHSAGGWDAIMLPLFYPGIWSAVGTNDAAIGIPWELIFDWQEVVSSDQEFRKFLTLMFATRLSTFFSSIFNSNILDYNEKNTYVKVAWELASRISPNPNNSNGVDLPLTENGEWVPEIREKWRDFSILEYKTIEKYRKELSQLSLNITVVNKNPPNTSGYENEYFIELLKLAGIPVNRMEMPGNHTDYIGERFIALVEAMLRGLNVTSVDSRGKVATTWGNIKNDN